jgi:hypothetical protein
MIINNLFQESADSQPDRTKHIVMVTVTDPNSTAVTQRKEPIQRRAVVSAVDQASAIDTAINFYKKQGYRVQDHHYVGSKDVDEGIVGDLAYKAGYGVGKVAGRGVAGYNAGKASNQPAQTPAQTVTNPSGPTLATGKRPDAFATKRAAAAKAAQDNMSPVTKSTPATPSPEEIRKAKQAAAIATFNMMGRGQKPNAPVDQLLQRRLAKQQGLKEGEEFGAYYSEQVAQQIFDKRQDISSEEEVLNQAYHIVSNDQGQKSAKYMFNYDEDFSGDVVSNYFHLQKQGVAEGYSGADDTDTVGFSVNSEQAYNAVMAKFGDYIDHDETSGMMYVPASIWPKVEMVAFDADGEGAVQDDGHESMSEDAVEEGLGSKLAGLGLAGAMALGSAGANARVTPDGQGGFTGGLKPSATAPAPADNKPAAEAPKGFSKEYLQKAADPNRFGRYMISVEKAQELLKNMQEGVVEGERTMSRAAKGYEKYGKQGMQALAKAGRDGASEEKLDTIRDKHNKYDEGVTEAGPYGSRNPDTMSANNYDRYQQDQMDYNKRDFKRREHEAEWEQEKAYSAKLAAQQAGPWYVRIDGKIVKDRQGNPYTFNSKAAVNKAALTMQAKPFNQGKKVMLTTNPNDTPQGVAEGAPIVIAQAPIDVRNPKKDQPKQRYMGDIVPPTKPPSTEKRGVKGRPGQRPMPEQGVAEGQTPEQEIERLKLRQNAEHGGASLKRQTDTQARIRELEKKIKDKKQDVAEAAPVNLDLWNRAKLVAESKFNVYPSKQASIYADKWYQQHGGTWINGQS